MSSTPALPAQIVSRGRWGARAALGPAMPARAALRLWLHHSVSRATSDPLADMRAIEATGIQRFGRYSYSWAIHPSGLILEGAGFTVGAHTSGQNSTSFGVVLIGNYDDQPMTDAQVASFVWLVWWLVSVGRLEDGAPIAGHRDQKPTACPGANAYRRLPELRRLVAAGPQPQPPPEEEEPAMTPEQFAIMHELECRRLGWQKADALRGLSAADRLALSKDADKYADDARKYKG